MLQNFEHYWACFSLVGIHHYFTQTNQDRVRNHWDLRYLTGNWTIWGEGTIKFLKQSSNWIISLFEYASCFLCSDVLIGANFKKVWSILFWSSFIVNIPNQSPVSIIMVVLLKIMVVFLKIVVVLLKIMVVVLKIMVVLLKIMVVMLKVIVLLAKIFVYFSTFLAALGGVLQIYFEWLKVPVTWVHVFFAQFHF